ncbi:MAG: hypothetical protein ABH845_06060 [Candidatus Omnitrophota bacterium]
MAVSSEKEKQQKSLALVLLAVLCLLIVWNLFRHATRPSPQIGQYQTTHASQGPSLPLGLVGPPSAPLSQQTSEETPVELPKKSALSWKRDPFLLALAKKGELPMLQLKVTGIIYHENRPEDTYAIINEEVHRIGDDLHGIKIVDIQPVFIRLKKFNQDVFLYLYQEEENE